MNHRNNWEQLLSAALALSALLIAGSVVYRTFLTSRTTIDAIGGGSPISVSDSLWQAARDLGLPLADPDDAGVTLVEFTDLECPACKGFQPTLDSAISQRPNLKVLYVPYPLPYHRFATAAGNAAECAAEQGALRPWIEAVFFKQDSIGLKSWMSFASEAGIRDTTTIGTCARSSGPNSRIRAGLALGDEIGVTGTPTIVVEGMRFTTPPSLKQLLGAIDDAEAVPQSSRISVAGRVLAYSTMAPIVHAEVALMDPNGVIAVATRTDSLGNYELRASEGRYRIRASREGYSPFLGSRVSEFSGEGPPGVIFLHIDSTDSR